jgi:hypothetical protein
MVGRSLDYTRKWTLLTLPRYIAQPTQTPVRPPQIFRHNLLHFPSAPDSDVAIVGRSLRESNAEHTEEHPPDPSRYQYDMV